MEEVSVELAGGWVEEKERESNKSEWVREEEEEGWFDTGRFVDLVRQ